MLKTIQRVDGAATMAFRTVWDERNQDSLFSGGLPARKLINLSDTF